MKFLVDENLPRALSKWLNARGHDAVHVFDLNLLGAADSEIAAAALSCDRILTTRDNDFDNLSAPAPKVLKLKIGNCSNAALFAWLELRLSDAAEHLQSNDFLALD